MSSSKYRECLNDAVSPITAKLYKRDLSYFWAWARIANISDKATYPVPVSWLIEFTLDHIQGLSPKRIARLQECGHHPTGRPLSPKTISRILVPLSHEHKMRCLITPFVHPKYRFLNKRLLHRTQNVRIKPIPITIDVLIKLLNACSFDIRGHRDRALLMVGFAGGGRRRSELSALSIEHLSRIENGYIARLPEHKTAGITQEPLVFPIFDSAARQLDRWLNVSGIKSGPVFRSIHHSGRILSKQMNGRLVSRVIKGLAERAGLPSQLITAHSLRSGFITEAAKQKIPLLEAMTISNHRSYDTAYGYYKPGCLADNPAAHMSAMLDSVLGIDRSGMYFQDH